MSSLLLMTFAVNARAIETSRELRFDETREVVSAETYNKDTVPHRGSGR
ncbi:MAG: hypothetical protein J7641_08890 [Cyanobacteria bacterium SID2]|nr:hypothetical protein [Cyanobacteria bacterium SID2]MBP0005383.1 hypothetical protein [Cyanobacteria bacterium SBC]